MNLPELAAVQPQGNLAYRPRRHTTKIILHDSHTAPDLNDSHPYLTVHGREMGLLSVGYHFVIERGGFVKSYRGYDLVGSHTPLHNHDSIGVCLMGGVGDGQGFTAAGEPEDNFTADQTKALQALVRGIRYAYGNIPLLGHGEVSRRAQCPCCNMEEMRHLCR